MFYWQSQHVIEEYIICQCSGFAEIMISLTPQTQPWCTQTGRETAESLATSAHAK